MKSVTYTTTILQFGNNTGIEISEEALEQLGAGKKPLVVVSLNGYSYRNAVAKMGGKFLISLSAENRKNANVKGGDTLSVTVALDTAPRTITVPEDLQDALDKSKLNEAFDKLAPSKRKAVVDSILEAKTAETRERRINKAITSLQG